MNFSKQDAWTETNSPRSAVGWKKLRVWLWFPYQRHMRLISCAKLARYSTQPSYALVGLSKMALQKGRQYLMKWCVRLLDFHDTCTRDITWHRFLKFNHSFCCIHQSICPYFDKTKGTQAKIRYFIKTWIKSTTKDM